MRTITTAERRARLGTRHGLGVAFPDVDDAAAAAVGLHSSDPATVFLSARARCDGLEVGDLENALYERRSLVRMLGMRRTLFVVSLEVAAEMDAACTRALAGTETARLARMLEEQGIATDGARWVERVERDTLAAVSARKEATAGKLGEDVPELRLKLTFGEGKTWGGTVGVSTRVLFLLATKGLIVRTRPLGTWLSSQYRWAPTEEWIGGRLESLETADAAARLTRRWLRSYGPGTLADLKWWTGWTVALTRRALADAGAVEVELDEGPGFVLADDVEPVTASPDWAALLPGLDPAVMGWKDRDWYLGGHGAALFDRNGNAGPTVWWNGRVVGGWGQRADGEMAVRLLEDPGAEARSLIDAEAERLATWLGDVRVTPRFRTPVEKELRG